MLHQVDDVDEANLQIRKPLIQDLDRRQRFHRRNVARARDNHVRIRPRVGGRPLPDADALRAVGHGIVHAEILKMFLLVCHNHVDVIPRAQAMVAHAEQAVRVWRQINADHVRALIRHDIQKARILMRKAVVILPPH